MVRLQSWCSFVSLGDFPFLGRFIFEACDFLSKAEGNSVCISGAGDKMHLSWVEQDEGKNTDKCEMLWIHIQNKEISHTVRKSPGLNPSLLLL